MDLAELLGDDGVPRDDEPPVGADSEWLSSARKSRRIETEMDMTPMIDITFLLLIFFLVASRMDENSAVALPTARHGTTVTVDDSAILTVIPNGRGVEVYKGESTEAAQRIQGRDLETQDELITAYVERELSADVPKQQVLIRAAKGIKYQEVARIISAAGLAEGTSVYVAVIEE